MDSVYQGHPPSRSTSRPPLSPPLPRRPILGDGTNRANESAHSQHHDTRQVYAYTSTPRTQHLASNRPIIPNSSPSVRQELASPENKRVSAVQAYEQPQHNPKRDSEISNASTDTSNSNRRRKTHIGPWQLGKTIGQGGCSRVRLVRHSVTGQYAAAKIISKAMAERVRAVSLANLCQSAEQDPNFHPHGKAIPFGLEREICIMKLLDHPNIVRLYDIWENRDELYIIMEFIEGGELFSYIQEQDGLIEIHAVHIFRQIIAALIYCHRINIHHRDLKPENILLDRSTMTVKLVDFGMAALQPDGKKLTTPCGSPHYAAPEVIRSTSYDGAKADVWSCGVVLFVLLTGTPPFNYSGHNRDLKQLFRDIAAAKYIMPDTISKEAQDLIRRILVPDTRRRISLQDIWDHPFLRKYQQELNFLGENAQLGHWTGPLPAISEWTMLEPENIDRTILRHLRTLWHSVKEEELVRKLTCREPNQEKFFYAALLKHHTDQLENYQPGSHHAVTYSSSDYHHTTRYASTRSNAANLQSRPLKHSQSAYSILNDEHLYSKHSLYEPPPSEASYDPYRASRQPMIPTPKDPPVTPRVKIYRGQSGRSDRPRPITALGHRTGSSLRAQALRNNSKRNSEVSRGSLHRNSPSQRSHSVQRYSMSRSSLASSRWPSSPPVIVRSSGARKRGVSFTHLHKPRSSVATVSSWQTEAGSCADYTSYRPRNSVVSHNSAMKTGSVCSNVKSKAYDSIELPLLKMKKSESPTKYIQGEIRKCSVELSKVMEEAFNRSSVASSTQADTDALRHAYQYDTPSTSFSNTHNSGGSTLVTPSTVKVVYADRPLPPIPAETPNSFVQRKLAETRAEIARKLREDGTVDRYTDILDALDRLTGPVARGDKRIVSAPAKSPGHGPLHVIPEEGKTDSGYGFESALPHHQVSTGPVGSQDHDVVSEQQQTIRTVEGSPMRPAPLNIRKRSGASSTSTKPIPKVNVVPWSYSDDNLTAPPRPDLQVNLWAAPIDNNVSVPAKQDNVIKKKKSWFRRDTDEQKKDDDKENQVKKKKSTGLLRIAEALHGSGNHMKNDPAPLADTSGPKLIPEKSDRSIDSEFPMRSSNPGPSKGVDALRKSVLALLGKKPKDEKGKNVMKLGELNSSAASILSDFDFEPESGVDGARTGPTETHMNWLSRFLHIKPASATLCLRVGRGKVRQDFVRLLRDWKRFGVRDVMLDRPTNTISARIDKHNLLKIKPVYFVIELFVVLEQGHRANLCLARFTQTRGAASSFRRVFDTIEDICRARGMAVEDEEKKVSMMGVLA